MVSQLLIEYAIPPYGFFVLLYMYNIMLYIDDIMLYIDDIKIPGLIFNFKIKVKVWGMNPFYDGKPFI